MPPLPPPPATAWSCDINGKTVQLGPLNVPIGTAINPSVVLGGIYGLFMNPQVGTGTFAVPGYVFTTSGLRRSLMVWDAGIKVNSDCEMAWSDTPGVADKAETGLSLRRDENNRLTQRNGINPQSYSLYNTWTDSTHFERADFGWMPDGFHVTTSRGVSGGSPRDLVLGADGDEVLRFKAGHSIAFFGVAPVVKQLSAGVINNVPASGTNDTFDDFADNDWTALRALCSQQARKIEELVKLVRNYGLAG